MCPKAKSDQVITHRIELQKTERESLELFAVSMAAKNLTASVKNVITPFTTATVAGVAWSLSILGGLWASANPDLYANLKTVVGEELKSSAWSQVLGPFWGTINAVSDDSISSKFESIMSNINDKYI